jgi:hypothetical protein
VAAVRWKGEIMELDAEDEGSPAREVRSHHWSHDVSWLGYFDQAGGRAVLAEVVPNLTRQVGERFMPVNDFSVNEVVVRGDRFDQLRGDPDRRQALPGSGPAWEGMGEGWYMVGEISTENAQRNYVPGRYVLPGVGERVRMRYRVLPKGDRGTREVDDAWIAWAGYRRRVEGVGERRSDEGGAFRHEGTEARRHEGVEENDDDQRAPRSELRMTNDETGEGEGLGMRRGPDRRFAARTSGPAWEGEGVRIELGVPGVSFGTSYFPHRTFGENFEYWRSAGLVGERWWPLFGANWRHFREDIRRDMRIANAMGLEWIRIHHFDAPGLREGYLRSPEGAWMLEYLDFMVRTARECDLWIFLDCAIGPHDAAMVAERYGDVIRWIEIQNEVLLTGVRLELVEYWREVYRRVKEVRPDVGVLLTGGPMFISMYDRLAALGVAVDGVGQHAYVDARQAPGYVRDIAVGVGGYAGRRGLVPVNSEFNWRMITRETEQAQAEHFEEIFEALLSQQQLPLLGQFQFIETFCVPPRVRGALRHYEPLRVDRTPKPQGMVFEEVIRRHALPESRARTLRVDLPRDLALRRGEVVEVPVRFENLTERVLAVRSRPVMPEGLIARDREEFELELEPGEVRTLTRRLVADVELPPGFHHFFERVRYDDQIHFGWGHAAHRASPRIDLATPPLAGVRYHGGVGNLSSVDLSRIDSAIFGHQAHALEVDWTLYLYHTLRAATGADIERFSDADLEAMPHLLEGNLLLVGSPGSNALLDSILDHLPIDLRTLPEGAAAVQVIASPFHSGRTIVVVTGADARGVERAASDLLRRYWRFAAAAVSFRAGMPPPEWREDVQREQDEDPEGEGLLDEHAEEEADTLPGQAVMIAGPDAAIAGEPVHLMVLDSSEPPGPAAGMALVAIPDEGPMRLLGVSDADGGVVAEFPDPGLYMIVAWQGDADEPLLVSSVPYQIRIEPVADAD